MIRIPLHDKTGAVVAHALIDDADAPIAAHRWHRRNGYAARKVSKGGTEETVRMHREIMGLVRGDVRQVDHANRDRLDNRRGNLRFATSAQNRQNTGSLGGSSRYRGVTWHARKEKWQAQVHLDGKCHYLGLFKDEVVAAKVARAFRCEHMPFSVEAEL